MPANAWKLTAIFRDDFAGWSESYYFNVSGTRTMGQVADLFVNQRVKCLGDSAYLNFIRVLDTNVPRAVSTWGYNRIGVASTGDGKQAVTNFAEDAYRTVLIPFKTGAGVRRYVMLSGVPDAWIERKDDQSYFGLNPAGATGYGAFRTWLVRNDWSLQIRVRQPAPGNPLLPVSALDVDADTGNYTVTLKAPVPWLEGDKITLLKLKGNNVQLAKGVRKVVALGAGNAPTLFAIDRGPRQDLGVPLAQGGAMAQKVVYTFDQATVTDDEPMLVSTRTRGRPYAARRGRRSAKR